MNDAKKQKHNQPSITAKPVSTPPSEVVNQASTVTMIYTQEVHERAEMITPFLAEILQKSVTPRRWGINE